MAQLVRRPAIGVAPDASLREVADVMVESGIGRIPVLDRGSLVGIVTRSDLLEAHRHRLTREHRRKREREPSLPLMRAESG